MSMNEDTTQIESEDIPDGAVRMCRMIDKFVKVKQCVDCPHFAGIQTVGDRKDHERRVAAGQPFWRLYMFGCKYPTFDSVMEIEL